MKSRIAENSCTQNWVQNCVTSVASLAQPSGTPALGLNFNLSAEEHFSSF